MPESRRFRRPAVQTRWRTGCVAPTVRRAPSGFRGACETEDGGSPLPVSAARAPHERAKAARLRRLPTTLVGNSRAPKRVVTRGWALFTKFACFLCRSERGPRLGARGARGSRLGDARRDLEPRARCGPFGDSSVEGGAGSGCGRGGRGGRRRLLLEHSAGWGRAFELTGAAEPRRG